MREGERARVLSALINGRLRRRGYTSPSIWAYDSIRGTHPLIAYPDHGARGAMNVGTDGIDIVWSYGEGKAPYEFGLYPQMSIMTAPYTTDPAALAPRKLRADMSTSIGTAHNQFAVGCGYAGRPTHTGGAEIVRLADGDAWLLNGDEHWLWSRVHGITCTELFLESWDKDTLVYNMARVPLASLGAPLPPDGQ